MPGAQARRGETGAEQQRALKGSGSMRGNNSQLPGGDKTVDMAIKEGSVGPAVIDIAKLYAQTGMFTYDPGFTSTASCESQITYIDGDAGVLLHRGFPLQHLPQQTHFLAHY